MKLMLKVMSLTAVVRSKSLWLVRLPQASIGLALIALAPLVLTAAPLTRRPVYGRQNAAPGGWNDVRVTLIQQCLNCHGGQKTRGGFDLSTRDGLLRGGRSGPVVVSGNAQSSKLYGMICHTTKPYMPSRGARLPDATLVRIAAWINAGAPYTAPLTSGTY